MDLTSKRLARIPKRNSTAFISDFLHSQRAFQKHYAAEGLVAEQTLDAPLASTQRIAPMEKGTRSIPQDDFLLGTPLLKPRVPAAKATDPSKKAAIKHGDKENPDGFRSSRLQVHEPTKGETNETSLKKAQGKRKANIQEELKKPKAKLKAKVALALKTTLDDEHAKRLEDRRDRKRVKKSIMQPPQDNDDDDKENSDNNNTKSKKQIRGSKQKVQPKGHASLAFMHGFPSTNVGKHRITVEPLLRTVGVFKKGKASFSSHTIDKTKKQGICFSESQFFKNAEAKPHKRKRERTPSSLSSSDASDDCATKCQKINGSHATPTKAQHTNPRDAETSSAASKSHDSQEPRATRKPYNPADSIVWDIERESYLEDRESTGRQGTVVVSLPQFRLGACDDYKDNDLAKSPPANQSISILELDPPSEMDCLADAHAASVLSLRPSESASRVASKNVSLPTPVGEARSVLMVSKFFPEGAATRDKPPVVSAKTPAPTSSLERPLKSAAEPPQICDSPQSTPRHLADGPHKNLAISGDNESLLGYPDSFLWPAGSFEDPWNIDNEEVAQNYVSEYAGSELAYPESFVWPADTFSVHQQEYEEYIGTDVNPTTYETPDLIDYDRGSDRGYYEPRVVDLDGQDDDLEALEDFDIQRYIEYPSAREQPDFELEACFSPVVPTEAENLYGSEGVYSLMDAQSLPDESDCSQYLNDMEQCSDDIVDGDDYSGLAGHVDRFSQGRALLYGLPGPVCRSFHEVPTVEAEVADLLRQSHWTPQRL